MKGCLKGRCMVHSSNQNVVPKLNDNLSQKRRKTERGIQKHYPTEVGVKRKGIIQGSIKIQSMQSI